MEIVPRGSRLCRRAERRDAGRNRGGRRRISRAALEQHSGIVFRGQAVTDEAQLAFSRRFGPLEVTKVGSLGAGTNLVILSTIDENGKVVPADHRLALRNKANQLWHTD